MVRTPHIVVVGLCWLFFIVCGTSLTSGQIEQKLVATDALAVDGYSHAIAISDQYIVIGSPGHASSVTAGAPGAIYIYGLDHGMRADSVAHSTDIEDPILI